MAWLIVLAAALSVATVVLGTSEDHTIGMRLAYFGAQNASLFWGTYRPQLYFGMRSRSPHSLLSGIMWHSLTDYQLSKHKV